MKLTDYFSTIDVEEYYNSLVKIDKHLKTLHKNGYYVVTDFSELNLDDRLTFTNNKIGIINQDVYYNCDKTDILELCIVGICAYNRITYYNSSYEYLSFIINNIDKYLYNGNIPEDLVSYYEEVLINNNIIYLNDFIKEKSSNSFSNSRKFVKATSAFSNLSESEKAYVYIFFIPIVVSMFFLSIIFLILKIG